MHYPLSRLMGLFPVNSFICHTIWAYAFLDILDKPISDSALFLPRVRAYRALDTALSHLFIFFGSRSCAHIQPPQVKNKGDGLLMLF